jgi:hypothetical protein
MGVDGWLGLMGGYGVSVARGALRQLCREGVQQQ